MGVLKPVDCWERSLIAGGFDWIASFWRIRVIIWFLRWP
jgi:hypothetical protein